MRQFGAMEDGFDRACFPCLQELTLQDRMAAGVLSSSGFRVPIAANSLRQLRTGSILPDQHSVGSNGSTDRRSRLGEHLGAGVRGG